MADLKTYAENTWCKGCGNFGILNAVQKAVGRLEELGTPRSELVITAGIGCHAKIFDYLSLSGVYGLHGRSLANAQGMKLANPDLKVLSFVGDGDCMGEGFAHVMFAAKRNADITVIMHNNGVYGLTTGQFTPTSAKGFRGRSTPHGSPEKPFNSLALLLEAGATYVARGYSGKIPDLIELIVGGVRHSGFAFIEVLQPCVTFNNTYDLYNEKTYEQGAPASDLETALQVARERDPWPVGLLYQANEQPFHKALLGDFNPVRDKLSREERLARVAKLLEAATPKTG